MKSIVLDTSILVAALLSPFGPPGRILDLILSGDLALAYDDRVLAEYREVLAREKFNFDPKRVSDVIEYIETAGQHTTAVPRGAVLPDPDDAMFLQVALVARTDALVTGNPRHFPAASRQGVVVLSPAQFLERWDVGEFQRGAE